MLDLEGNVSSWNVGAQRIKGYTPQEIIGQHFSRFYIDEDRAEGLPAKALKIAVEEGRFEREGWRLRKDGTRFWASVIIDPIRADDGTLVGSCQGYTRRQREARSAGGAHPGAEDGSASVRLTGGMAHDFNNLLSLSCSQALRWHASALSRDGGCRPDRQRHSGCPARCSTHPTSPCISARRQELSFETVDITDLVRGMADLLQRAIGPEIPIPTQFPICLSKVKSDPTPARERPAQPASTRAMPCRAAGPSTIGADHRSISTSSPRDDLPAGEYVCLFVKDEGEGMDEDACERGGTLFHHEGHRQGNRPWSSNGPGLMAQSWRKACSEVSRRRVERPPNFGYRWVETEIPNARKRKSGRPPSLFPIGR